MTVTAINLLLWKATAIMQCGKNAGQINILCSELQITSGEITQFSDKENHGEHEMPAIDDHQAKLNYLCQPLPQPVEAKNFTPSFEKFSIENAI